MTETLLLIVIGLLTVNILFVGVYIVLVLKEVRAAVQKMNQILDSIATISEAVATPVAGATGAVAAVTAGVKAFQKLKSIAEHNKKEKDESEE
ncbi:hypothetical protein A2797_01675 [candidate division WWE3 bacterium RIFCSPHIGHO2_01_FULL_48_15]|uniref:Uncharacterized protein n=1 Tax=candidate division WWE3 bacterium RIFCSPHIGHO2_01_FULL_48_15 TaxID=1802619 RepID=A0A1F4VBT3_UNCKA|nr:MAG: hypothetical protein A2797_01675 [candidate division WWE3 bacterium RIFCSPHIGHO2_01_FULL_48_15]